MQLTCKLQVDLHIFTKIHTHTNIEPCQQTVVVLDWWPCITPKMILALLTMAQPLLWGMIGSCKTNMLGPKFQSLEHSQNKKLIQIMSIMIQLWFNHDSIMIQLWFNYDSMRLRSFYVFCSHDVGERVSTRILPLVDNWASHSLCLGPSLGPLKWFDASVHRDSSRSKLFGFDHRSPIFINFI